MNSTRVQPDVSVWFSQPCWPRISSVIRQPNSRTCEDGSPVDRSFVGRLNAGETLIADGATATNYQQMGMAIGVAPEEWVFDQPDKVRGLHAAFIDAGADIILTDTFGGTALRLRESR